MPVRNKSGDTAGSIIASVMILFGVVTWWDTTTMTDPDSFVFPRAVIIAMIVFSLILIVFNMLRPGPPKAVNGGSHLRRVLLVAFMLAGVAVMPWFGFFISGLVVFAALMVIAMYDPWTRFRIIVYPLSGIAIVTGFYFMFANLLLVPLPAGALFD